MRPLAQISPGHMAFLKFLVFPMYALYWSLAVVRARFSLAVMLEIIGVIEPRLDCHNAVGGKRQCHGASSLSSTSWFLFINPSLWELIIISS